MPTILEAYNPNKGRPWAPDPLPDDLKDNEYYWFNPMTNEVFKSFEDYCTRAELYAARVWSCRITGKGSLTYKEALEAEEEISEFLEDFPEEHLRVLLKMVHGSLELLEAMTNKVHKKLQSYYVPGEIVRWKRKTAEIVELDKEKTTQNILYYVLRWTDKKDRVFTEVVPSSEMLRQGFSLTWSSVRLKIRQVARRKKVKGSPWIVPEETLVEYGVLEEIDPEAMRLVKEHEDQISRKTKRSSKQSEDEKEKPKKRRKKTVDEEEKEKKKKREEMRRAYRLKLNHMLPVEDIALLYLQERKEEEETSFPTVSPFDYPIPQESFPDTLMLWRFLNYFAKPLSLSPFPFSHFLQSLSHSESISIIDETFVSLLRSVAPSSPSHIHRGNWEEGLLTHLMESSQTEPLEKLRPVIGNVACVGGGEDSMDGSEINGESEEEEEEDEEMMGEGEEGERVNGYISAGDLERRKEKREIRELFMEGGWEGVGLLDRIRTLRILSDDALDSMTKGLLRKSLDQSLEKKTQLQKEKWQTTREIGKKVKQLDEDIQSKTTLSSSEEIDPSLSERQKCKQLLEESKVIKKLESAKKMQQDLISRKTEALNRKIERFHIREPPLGYDRWFNRYWYFPEVPEKLFVERSPYYSSKRQKELLDMGGPEERDPAILEEEHYFPGDMGEEGGGEAGVFEYFDTKEQLEQLYDHLNEGGVRERKLVANLESVFSKIVSSASKKQQEAVREALGEVGGKRRSTRIKSSEKEKEGISVAPYLTYVNAWDKGDS